MDTEFKPKNVIAKFVDQYGEEQIIHRAKGRRLSIFKGGKTPALALNRAAVQMIGDRIKERRLKSGLTMKQLCQRAGLVSQSPKQYIWSIENALRMQGMRMGTLYALAYALECEPSDLMPSVNDVLNASQVKETGTKILDVE